MAQEAPRLSDPVAPSPLAALHRALTVGLLLCVTIVAFQALGISTVLPAAARDLGGLEGYGWAFSAFLLPSLLGIVAGGQAADRGGVVRPFVAAALLFTAGSVVAAFAETWGVLLAGRALQGLGVGAVNALVYAAVARGFSDVLYGRMLALLSSAWVLPSLVGPVLAGLLAEALSWRAVFLALLPVLAAAVLLAVPGLRTVTRPAGARGPSRLPAALALVAGTGVVLAALELHPVLAAALGLAGAAVALRALARLLPAGTLRAARGMPSSVGVRGLAAVAFLGADAFLPLALTELRGLSLAQAGLVISAGSVSWSAGALLQGRRERGDAGAGRAGRSRAGLVVVLAGLALTAAGVLVAALGTPAAVAGWVLAGLGIGTTYPASGALALAGAGEGAEGEVSAALQLVETLGVAVFAGLGGVAVALAVRDGSGPEAGIVAVFGAAVAVAVAGRLLARRLEP